VENVGEFNVAVWVSWLLVEAVYWAHGLLAFLFLDLNRYPTVLYKYKLQDKISFQVKGGRGNPSSKKLFLNLFLNHVCVLLPMNILLYYLSKWNIVPSKFRLGTLPSFFEILWQVVLFVFLEEIGFFYSHWLFHAKPLYTRFHKIHHEFHSPIALAASYVHPIEMIFCNIIPITLGPLLVGCHIVTFWLWGILAVLGTQVHHCGFRFPWQPKFDQQPDFHDYHHENFTSNYGLLGILDYLHGTDKPWRNVRKQKSQEFRNRIINEKKRVP